MKRRTFLKAGVLGGGATALLGLTSCTTFSPSSSSEDSRMPAATLTPTKGLRIRYEVTSKEAQKDLQIYKKGVEILRKNPRTITVNGKKTTSGLSFAEQAEIHMNFCPHGTWKFFPWHREYLYRFEEIIRDVTGEENFALPYWDWSKNQKLPKEFGEAGSLFLNEANRTRNLKPSIDQECSPSRISSFKKTKDFNTFLGSEQGSGEIEYAPHNTVHVAIGGTMATFRSPLDPIFWCHHANVDRLWAEWQEGNNFFDGKSPIKDYEKWLALSLDGFYDRKGVLIPKDKVRMAKDVIDPKNLGYLYDTSTRKTVSNEKAPAKAAMAPAPFTRRTIVETEPMAASVEADRDPGTYIVRLKDLPDDAFVTFRSYLEDPEAYQDYLFNMKVIDVPDFPHGTQMTIQLIVGSHQYNVLYYVVFKDPNSPHAHHDMKRTLNFDYTKTLNAIFYNEGGVYPQKTEFRVTVETPDGQAYVTKDPDLLGMKYSFSLFGPQR